MAGALQNFGHYLVPERRWGARSWPKLIAGLDSWIVEMLDSHRKIILQIEARMDQLEENASSGIETGADFRSFFPYRLSVSRSSRGARKHTQPFQK
jgi:hypothetical protein